MATDQAAFAPTRNRIQQPASLPLAADVSAKKPRPAQKALPATIKNLRNHMGASLNRLGLESADFTVISNDCWGQALYEEWGLPVKTPLAGSGMHAECFLRFLGDLPGYLSAPLHFIQSSRHPSVNRLRNRRQKWPMAVLRDDVEVHFLHYDNEEDSRASWERGCLNMNLDRLVVKFTIDKDGALPEHIAQFARLPFARKLLISERAHPGIDCAIQVPNYVINGAMMFRRSLRHFDCAHWLNTGEIRQNTARVYANKFLYARGV